MSTPTTDTSKSNRPGDRLDLLVQAYGDILFDLCETVLWSQTGALTAFRAILRDLRRKSGSDPYSQYERAWVLKIAYGKLQSLAARHARRLTPSEQIALNSNMNVPARFKDFNSFFHRLNFDDQILLLLRDKYGIPYHEVSAAMGMPEGSLKIRRQQALRMLEEWLWDKT